MFLHESDFNIGQSNVPNSFREAVSCWNSDSWVTAKQEELMFMKDNNLGELLDLLDNFKLIGLVTWIFKTKKDSRGNAERFKARLVAKSLLNVKRLIWKIHFHHYLEITLSKTLALVAHFDLRTTSDGC